MVLIMNPSIKGQRTGMVPTESKPKYRLWHALATRWGFLVYPFQYLEEIWGRGLGAANYAEDP